MTRSTLTAQAPPRTSTLDRPTLMTLAATEYERFAATLRSLTPADWAQSTDCPGWDVRDMAGHCLGMAEMAASIRELARQQKHAGQRGGVFIDALTAVQVEKNANLTVPELIAQFAEIGPKAARARRRTPGLIRSRTMPVAQQVGDQEESWTNGFLVDTILTRDPWMHRMDIARAIGKPPELTADHDGVIVADVVDEWATRHGRPVQLTLTGPAGGRWTFGDSGPSIESDAIDYCRTLSGREPAATGLLTTQVPF
ncbi:MAG: maleylpyruvate isomerase family mycothiol-dependent enzyme [Aeromicrobium sp.]